MRPGLAAQCLSSSGSPQCDPDESGRADSKPSESCTNEKITNSQSEIEEEKLEKKSKPFVAEIRKVKIGDEEVNLRIVTNSKLNEDKTDKILGQMRKRKKELQMEKQFIADKQKNRSSWREKMDRRVISENCTLNCSTDVKLELQENTNRDNPLPIVNPLEFILMKEAQDRINPPKKRFTRDRSVESDCGGKSTIHSVIESLKKLVKTINPAREFPGDVAKKEQAAKPVLDTKPKLLTGMKEKIDRMCSGSRRWKSSGFEFGSRWRSCQELRTKEEHRKAIRDVLQFKVLSKTRKYALTSILKGLSFITHYWFLDWKL